MPPRYKFIYFDMKGRGELTRLIFAQGRIEYDDYRITRERWLTEFKSSGFLLTPVQGPPSSLSNLLLRYAFPANSRSRI